MVNRLMDEARRKEKPIFAVCGKGGVGKTVFSALFARALLEGGSKRLLLIDADPVGGLVSAIGERTQRTLAGVRQDLLAAARNADDATKMRLAEQIDYLVMEALVERDGYALLAIGRSQESGCYCPANRLLRDSIDLLAGPFSTVLIDAEAGLEQIHRQVTRSVNQIIGITDGSKRGGDVLRMIAEMVDRRQVVAVGNRLSRENELSLPQGVELAGTIPSNAAIREFDRAGRSLWDLPADDTAYLAVKRIADRLMLNGFYASSAAKIHTTGGIQHAKS